MHYKVNKVQTAFDHNVNIAADTDDDNDGIADESKIRKK